MWPRPELKPLCAWAMLAMASLLMLATTPERADAASAEEIDIKADAALARFRNEVSGADEFLRRAAGVLVFPRVIKAGLGIGGEYGEGALRVAGKTVAYYNTAAALLIGLGVVATSLLLDRPPENATAHRRASSTIQL